MYPVFSSLWGVVIFYVTALCGWHLLFYAHHLLFAPLTSVTVVEPLRVVETCLRSPSLRVVDPREQVVERCPLGTIFGFEPHLIVIVLCMVTVFDVTITYMIYLWVIGVTACVSGVFIVTFTCNLNVSFLCHLCCFPRVCRCMYLFSMFLKWS